MYVSDGFGLNESLKIGLQHTFQQHPLRVEVLKNEPVCNHIDRWAIIYVVAYSKRLIQDRIMPAR